jgi:hypothetical protein
MLAMNIVVKLRTSKCCKRMAGCTTTSGTQRDEFKGAASIKSYCGQKGSGLAIPGARSQRIIKVRTCPYF